MTPFCPNCREQIDPQDDVPVQREHSAPCLICNSDGHSACQH